jgi:hypothetical protein
MAPYSLGTNKPNEMDVVNIQPPHQTAVTISGDQVEDLDLRVTAAPNPSAAEVTFTYSPKTGGTARLSVYNPAGKQIWQSGLVSQHRISWPGTDSTGRRIASGTYYYRLQAGSCLASGKIQLR